MSATRERPVQRYSEALGLGAEGQGYVVEVVPMMKVFSASGLYADT